MGVKERILTIRLMEKISENPSYAEKFGIAIVNGPAEHDRQNGSDSAGK